MSEIESSLEFGSLEKVKTIISEESKLLKDRNKKLKIADTHGWDTVKEYDTGPLADNSDDANKLRTAINRARYASKFKPYVSSTQGSRSSVSTGSTGQRFPSKFQLFPSLKCDLERLCKEQRADILGKTNSIHRAMPSQSNVTPVTSKDTLIRSVRTEQVQSRPETRVIQQQHSLPQQSPNSSRVEYSFHIQNTNITIVNGRLIKCLDFWKSELNASSFVLNIISDSYKIPFVQQPSSVLLKNNRSALEHEDFVSNEIHALLQKQCIEEVDKPPFLSIL